VAAALKKHVDLEKLREVLEGISEKALTFWQVD
jgi:uncharacterized protein (DUF2267 family)